MKDGILNEPMLTKNAVLLCFFFQKFGTYKYSSYLCSRKTVFHLILNRYENSKKKKNTEFEMIRNGELKVEDIYKFS